MNKENADGGHVCTLAKMHRIGLELSRDGVLSLGIFHPQFGVRLSVSNQPSFLNSIHTFDPRITILSGMHGDAVFVFGNFLGEFPNGDFPQNTVGQ